MSLLSLNLSGIYLSDIFPYLLVTSLFLQMYSRKIRNILSYRECRKGTFNHALMFCARRIIDKIGDWTWYPPVHLTHILLIKLQQVSVKPLIWLLLWPIFMVKRSPTASISPSSAWLFNFHDNQLVLYNLGRELNPYLAGYGPQVPFLRFKGT